MDKRASDAWESKIGLLFQVNVMLTSDSGFPVVSNWDEFVKEASFFFPSLNASVVCWSTNVKIPSDLRTNKFVFTNSYGPFICLGQYNTAASRKLAIDCQRNLFERRKKEACNINQSRAAQTWEKLHLAKSSFRTRPWVTPPAPPKQESCLKLIWVFLFFFLLNFILFYLLLIHMSLYGFGFLFLQGILSAYGLLMLVEMAMLLVSNISNYFCN